MPHDALAPLEEAVEAASRRLNRLHAQLRQVRAERDRLAAKVAELELGSSRAGSADERLTALRAERNEVRERLGKLLDRIGGEVGDED